MAETDSDLLEFLYQSPIGLCQTDIHGQIQLSTPVAAQLLMPLASDGAFENIFDLLDKTAPELRNAVIGFQKKRGPIVIEHRCPILDAEGAVISVLAVTATKINANRLSIAIADISSLVAKEQEAHLSAQMFNSIVENLHGYEFCALDQSGLVSDWNVSGERLSGHLSPDILGQPFSVLIVDEYDAARVAAGDAAALLGDDADDGDWPALLAEARADGSARRRGMRLRKSGELFFAETMVTLLRRQDGGCVGYSVVTREMSEERAREQALLDMAARDPLTGALNRRGFFNHIARSVPMLAERGKSYAVAVADLDLFKQLNDEHGHAAGDAALKAFVEAIGGVIRSDDQIGRIGGEEFALFFPDMSAEAARFKADLIRETVSNLSVPLAQGAVRFTVSIGVATPAAPTEALSAVIDRADRAMYAAKQAGRNRVEAAA